MKNLSQVFSSFDLYGHLILSKVDKPSQNRNKIIFQDAVANKKNFDIQFVAA